LEALIKAGAFDEFGARAQLLEVVDQMIHAGNTVRRAAQLGQGMLFDALDSAESERLIVLPKKFKDIPRRVLLQEERELLGTYVSEHPLQAQLGALQHYVTHTSATLTESDHGQRVVVAGVVTVVRPHTTKAGKTMAFAEVEDIYGRLELTIFPQTWADYQHLFQKDKPLLIWGKAEVTAGSVPKLLVEKASDSFEIARSADDAPVDAAFETTNGDALSEELVAPIYDAIVRSEAQTEADAQAPAEPSPTHAAPSPVSLERTIPTPSDDAIQNPHPRAQDVPPIFAAREPLYVILQRNGDPRSDVARLEAVLQTLRKYKGDQPFAIVLDYGNGKKVTIDFPNDATNDCPELQQELRNIGAHCRA
jgi:hypothetical protein